MRPLRPAPRRRQAWTAALPCPVGASLGRARLCRRAGLARPARPLAFWRRPSRPPDPPSRGPGHPDPLVPNNRAEVACRRPADVAALASRGAPEYARRPPKRRPSAAARLPASSRTVRCLTRLPPPMTCRERRLDPQGGLGLLAWLMQCAWRGPPGRWNQTFGDLAGFPYCNIGMDPPQGLTQLFGLLPPLLS